MRRGLATMCILDYTLIVSGQRSAAQSQEGHCSSGSKGGRMTRLDKTATLLQLIPQLRTCLAALADAR